MEQIRLNTSQIKQAAVIYSRAFFDYPQFTCYHPSRDWRTRHFTSYCELGLRFALRYGEVYTNGDFKGIIGWFAPHRNHFTSSMYLVIPEFYRQAILIGWKNLSRITACEDYAAKVHGEVMPEPHWYLWGLAVDPDYHGQGIGTQLMEPGLKRADEQGLPTYLETHDEDNIAYYQKRGFELVRSEHVPGIGLPFWCLVHQPES
jgi:ribosomal protein S18 acetylase RimI-like enzyme